MLMTVREICCCSSSSLLCFNSLISNTNYNSKHHHSLRVNRFTPICKASSLSFHKRTTDNTAPSWNLGLFHSTQSCDSSVFDPLGINSGNSSWDNLVSLLSQTFESSSNTRKEKNSSARGLAAAIEDTSIDFGDFFKGPLPGKFLKLLGFLALSRLGIYIPLGGVNREAFVGNLDENSILSTLDSFSGGGIGRLGICSLGIVPFINAQIVFQLLAQIYPKLQELQKREGEAGRKKVLQYTRYASVGFAVVQATGQVLFLRPYVNDFSTQWAISSVVLLTLGSVFTTYIGERITDLNLGNGTSLLIFTNIISYLPASFGRTVAQAYQDGNYVGLVGILVSFFLLVLSIVYVQEAEENSAKLCVKVYWPNRRRTSKICILTVQSSFYLPTNILLIAFFSYYYTFLQLDPDDVSDQLKQQGASIPLVRPGTQPDISSWFCIFGCPRCWPCCD